MWALSRGGFNKRIFNFHKTLSHPLMATSNLIRVSSPAYSTGSPAHATFKRVGTHNGSFHCDEALGCFMIRLTDKFSHSEIVRTRDPKVLEGLDAVLDVGGVYDPSHDRYDHHQKGFEVVFGHGFSTKLSSAGLVYKHFGKEIIAKELQLGEDHPDVHRLFLAIYKSFMEAIDAVDNGINQFDTDKPPRYVNNTHLSSRVGRLNLDWTDPDQSPEKENKAFQQAMALAGSEFLESVRFHAKSWLPARSIVMECIAERFDIDPSGEIMVLKRFCPWKLHLFELEEELKIEPPIKYVLYEDERGKQWRVQAVAVSPDRFESRRPLPAQWRGLRDDELTKELFTLTKVVWQCMLDCLLVYSRTRSRTSRLFVSYRPMAELVGPRLYSCCNCRNQVALHDDVISKSFQGRNGRAFLFSHAMNIMVGPKEDRQLMTGLHTVADVYCCDCREVLGWKYERAYEESQKYKEGKFILEKSKIVIENW